MRRRLLSMTLMFLLLLVLAPLQIGVIRANVSTTTSTSQQSMIMILVEFTDTKHTTSQEKMHDTIFTGLNTYYEEVSYGQIEFTGNTVGWYQLPNPEKYYATGRDKDYDRSRVRPFVKAAVDAAGDDVDFSKYSYVVVVHAGDMKPLWQSFYASSGTIGSPIVTGPYNNRVAIKEAVVMAEKNDLGIIVHEIGHYLGYHMGHNLYDLYDWDLQNEGKYAQVFMGSWCLMSVANGQGMCAWTKLKLGWIQARAVVTVVPWRSNTTVTIDPLELPSLGVHVIKIPLTDKTYYLVEVRQRIGVDKILPSSGVLTTLADDSKYESTKKGPVRVIDSTPETSTLNDATFDLGQAKKSEFFDRENNLAVVIVGKLGLSYKIFVGPVSEGEIAVKQQEKFLLTTTAIEEAKASIQRAETEGRTEGLDRAKSLLANSSAALDKDDYAAALAFAKQAKEVADAAVRPTILAVTTTTTTEPQKKCIIASVAYGSELAPEVQSLRTFRDSIVTSTQSGRAFMSVFNKWYYSFSTQVANAISGNPPLRDAVKTSLYPLIGVLSASANIQSTLAINPELATVMTGLVASALMGLVYLFQPMLLVSTLMPWRSRDKERSSGQCSARTESLWKSKP